MVDAPSLWAHDDPPSTADVYQFNLLDDMSEIQLKETELWKDGLLKKDADSRRQWPVGTWIADVYQSTWNAAQRYWKNGVPTEGNVLWVHDDPPSTTDVYQFNFKIKPDMSEIQLKGTELKKWPFSS